jgi:uracil-DNA glycosylase
LFTPSNQYASLDEALNAIMQMEDDPLANAGTNIVISRGNPSAKLLIIGEAPGPEENIRGKCCVPIRFEKDRYHHPARQMDRV